MIDMKCSSMRLCDKNLFQFNFFEQTFNCRCCSISKSVNNVSDHGFKCLLVSVISTDKSTCAAQYRFASVFSVTIGIYRFVTN